MDDLVGLYSDLLTQIEEHAKRLLKPEFASLQELWQFELELVKYQSKLQQAVAREKLVRQELKTQSKLLVSTKAENPLEPVQQLEAKRKQVDHRIKIYRHAHQLSPQTGDAFAWVFLNEAIRPLTELPSNTRDGHHVADEHSLKGLLAIAEFLANSGAGFPILHDVTNCLRVGDITFYSPENEPATIEVKTHLIGNHEGILSLEVEAHHIDLKENKRWDAIMNNIPKHVSLSVDSEDNKQTTPQFPTQLEDRLQRQMERMKRAKLWQSMPDDRPFKLGDREEGIKVFMHSEEELHHWDVIQELAIKAKKDGFAVRVVDDAFVYMVFYRDSSVAYPWIRGIDQSFSEDLTAYNLPSYLVSSSLLYPEPEKNKLWVPVTTNVIPYVLPFYLYPLPTDFIMDIMWGRLVIGITVNLGKLVAALQDSGLDARLPKDSDEFNRLFLPVSSKVSLPDNKQALVELRNLHFYGSKIAHEFLSLKGFVKLVSQMAQIGIKRAQDREAEKEHYAKINPTSTNA